MSIKAGSYFDSMNQIKKAYSRLLEPICRKWDLTRNELDVMLFLHNNPEYDRAVDIVTRRGMAKSHVSLSVANLEQRCLLQRRESEEDRRTVHLMLTEAGSRIAREGRETQAVFFTKMYEGVERQEFEVWQSVTQKIRENLTNMNVSEAD